MKRIFDIIFAITAIIITSPLFLTASLFIILESKGRVFYKSRRIGRHKKPFKLFKFRTMYPDSDKMSITVGNTDPRITRTGYWLRKFKIDELPQFINVIKGDMSIVGPRPDVPEYSEFYTHYMPDYFEMKPGITSYSSIYFSNESELYVNSSNPEKKYVEETIPKKVELDRPYYEQRDMRTDLLIILKTIQKILKNEQIHE